MSQVVDGAAKPTLFLDGEQEEQRQELFEAMKRQAYELYAVCVEFGQYDTIEVWDRWAPKAMEALRAAEVSMGEFAKELDKFIQHEATIDDEYRKLSKPWTKLVKEQQLAMLDSREIAEHLVMNLVRPFGCFTFSEAQQEAMTDISARAIGEYLEELK